MSLTSFGDDEAELIDYETCIIYILKNFLYIMKNFPYLLKKTIKRTGFHMNYNRFPGLLDDVYHKGEILGV